MSNQNITVEKTLNQREDQYGSFEDVAKVSQNLQATLLSYGLSTVQKEAMQMICSKLARITCGDCNHIDSWHDIAGYATLVVNSLTQPKQTGETP